MADAAAPTTNGTSSTQNGTPKNGSASDVRALLEEHTDPAEMTALAAWARAYDAERPRLDAAEAAKRREAEDASAKHAAVLVLERLADRLPDDHGLIADALLAASRPRLGRSAAEVLAQVPAEPDWLIPGWLGRTWAVKIAAREKVGKGKFVMTMLGHLERGEATPFGEATSPASALIFTEEPEDSIREKIAEAGLTEATIVHGWDPGLAGLTWEEKVQAIVAEATRAGHGVLFVDNISRAAGVEDEAGVELARRAETLFEAAKAAGLAVIVDHHHRKAAGKTEDKSRGGTALAGATDCNVELETMGNAYESRVRRLSSRGRITATIWTRTIALAEDGRSYETVADDHQPQRGEDRRRLRTLRDAGDAGVTAPAFGEAIEKGEDTARTTLLAFVAEGWATASGKRPVVYRVTPEGEAAAKGVRPEDEPDALDF